MTGMSSECPWLQLLDSQSVISLSIAPRCFQSRLALASGSEQPGAAFEAARRSDQTVWGFAGLDLSSHGFERVPGDKVQRKWSSPTSLTGVTAEFSRPAPDASLCFGWSSMSQPRRTSGAEAGARFGRRFGR
mmetsp:Transcript_86794/g.231605  ORF Transcript_86794/g.231605 Transcript_86794/m.231605 type:complete len:132 (+) Transcript_86794:526-921(+)